MKSQWSVMVARRSTAFTCYHAITFVKFTISIDTVFNVLGNIKRRSTHAAHAAIALRWRVCQLLKYLIKKVRFLASSWSVWNLIFVSKKTTMLIIVHRNWVFHVTQWVSSCYELWGYLKYDWIFFSSFYHELTIYYDLLGLSLNNHIIPKGNHLQQTASTHDTSK